MESTLTLIFTLSSAGLSLLLFVYALERNGTIAFLFAASVVFNIASGMYLGYDKGSKTNRVEASICSDNNKDASWKYPPLSSSL